MNTTKNLRGWLFSVCITGMMICSNPIYGVTVTLTDPDPAVTMGALEDKDNDAHPIVSLNQDLTPTKPYISTFTLAQTATPFYYTSANRRGIAEFALSPLEVLSQEPNAIASAVLTFYFDDVIFPDLSLAPYTAQAFTVECYTDTANGVLDVTDTNDADPLVTGEGLNDWQGAVLQSWEFTSADMNNLTPGPVVGVFGPNEPYPANYGDDQFNIFGIIGFAIDVTHLVQQTLADPNVDYIGFRWISRTEGGFWTSMDPKGNLPTLTVDMTADEPLTFDIQSSDSGPITGDHGGRPYHQFDGPDDEAIYIAAGDWQGAHTPDDPVAWPVSDGIIDWTAFADPNQNLEQQEAVTYTPGGDLRYVYWNTGTEKYVLVSDQNDVSAGLEKVYYEDEFADQALWFGNDGIPVGGRMYDRQFALLTEFNLLRPNRYNIDPNSLVSATLELTFDEIVDMSLTGGSVFIPSQMYINAYAGDGILNDFANVQADFDRVDPNTADVTVWLTLDGTPDGLPITDFAISYWKLVDPGLGEQLTLKIDITDAVRSLLEQGVDFVGLALSGSPDGDFALASLDYVDTVNNISYLPKLVLKTDLQ